MSYLKMGNGFLQRSDYYEAGGPKPEFFGKITIGQDGDEAPFEGILAAWVKTNPDTGKKFFSIAVSVKDVAPEAPAEPETEPEAEENVPF